MNIKAQINELVYHAALMRLDKLDIKKVQEIFDSLMQNGIFHNEFIDIAYPNSNYTRDSIPSFEAALRKLKCKIPADNDEAVSVIVKFYLIKITNSEIDPLKGLSNIINDVSGCSILSENSKHFLGDSHGIENLISLYWHGVEMRDMPSKISCNDKYGEDAIIELKKLIVNSAYEWLEKYG